MKRNSLVCNDSYIPKNLNEFWAYALEEELEIEQEQKRLRKEQEQKRIQKVKAPSES